MRIRIYFNRWADLPLIWSFDHGTQESEVSITDWNVVGCDIEDGYDPNVSATEREIPRVWMEVLGAVACRVEDDVLYVYGNRFKEIAHE